MYDAKDIVRSIKKAAIDAVDARQDCDFIYGQVISIEPLTISIAQGIDLTDKQLVLTKNVTDYDATVVIEGETRNAKIKNALEEDDTVVLLRKKGGQTYLVLDKVVEENDTN